MNEVIERYIALAREAEEQRRLAQEAEWQTELAQRYEMARSFIEYNDLGDLLATLEAGEIETSERDYIATVPLVYVVKGWRYSGRLEIYHGSGTVKGKFTFGDGQCGIYLPQSPVEIGDFLLELERVAQRQYASRLGDAVKRMLYLDQPVLDQRYNELLKVFPQALEVNAAYSEALLRIEEERKQTEGRAREARALEEKQKREDEARNRMQSEVFYPFVVYKINYGVVVTFDDGDVMVESNAAYSLRPEPDAGGWWTFVSSISGEEIRQMRVANLISVERLEITEPGNLCSRVDGVWYPPVGAERLSVVKEQ